MRSSSSDFAVVGVFAGAGAGARAGAAAESADVETISAGDDVGGGVAAVGGGGAFISAFAVVGVSCIFACI